MQHDDSGLNDSKYTTETDSTYVEIDRADTLGNTSVK